MKRREFITALGGASAATIWPLVARSQQPMMPVIGFLGTRASGDDPQLLTAFRQGLKDSGLSEGQNVAIEYRFAENQYARLPALAAELVGRRVAVIVANGLRRRRLRPQLQQYPSYSRPDSIRSRLGLWPA